MNEQNNPQPIRSIQNSKNIWIIVVAVIIIALVVGGGILAWQRIELKSIKQDLQQQIIVLQEQNVSLQEKINNLQGQTQQQDEIDTSDWVLFNSLKDTTVKTGFSFKHPKNWFQIGSIDGGPGSLIPFYDKNQYPADLKEHPTDNKGALKDTVAYVSLLIQTDSEEGQTHPIYRETKEQSINIAGHQGTRVININPSTRAVEEIILILPEVEKEVFGPVGFKFVMPTKDDGDVKIFDEIIKTIKFD